MSEEHFIITVYCFVEELFKEITKDFRLRSRGSAPSLRDEEVLTMLIVGEFLGLGSDKKIWSYFKSHYYNWFPGLGSRTSFVRQGANLMGVMSLMQTELSKQLITDKDLYLFDGFPIPVCHIKRYKRSSPFRGTGAVGYCASKDQKYFGFKGHLLISVEGVTKGFCFSPANVDERDVLPSVVEKLSGDVIADKGLIRPELREKLAGQGMNLHTPLRKNMNESRPKEFIRQIMNIRRKVETVIGQLVDRFHIQKIRAKDNWHLMAKIGRKILAHTMCFLINKSVNPEKPLRLEDLIVN